MKIPLSVRSLYEEQLPKYRELKRIADARVLNLRSPQWHYESRVKPDVSFALKLETGRVPNPAAMEDFFACTIVVENRGNIVSAEQLVRTQFEVKRRRPESDALTHKRSDSFPFDELRLY